MINSSIKARLILIVIIHVNRCLNTFFFCNIFHLATPESFAQTEGSIFKEVVSLSILNSMTAFSCMGGMQVDL